MKKKFKQRIKEYFINIKVVKVEVYAELLEHGLFSSSLNNIYRELIYLRRGLFYKWVTSIILNILVILIRILFIGILGFLFIPIISHFRLRKYIKEIKNAQNIQS